MSHVNIAAGVDISIIDEQKISLAVYGRQFIINDRDALVRDILTLAKRGEDMTAIKTNLSEKHGMEKIDAVIRSLAQTGVLETVQVQVSKTPAHAQFAYLRYLLGDKPSAPVAIDPALWHVAIAGEGNLADALANQMQELGITLTRLATELPLPSKTTERLLLVHCADFEDFASFRDLNQRAWDANIPALYVSIDSNFARVGPLVIPQAGACYECYFHRVRAGRKSIPNFDARSDSKNYFYRPVPAQTSLLWAQAEAVRTVLAYLSGTMDDLHQNPMTEINTTRGEIERSRLLRLPRCSVCGVANSRHRPLSRVYHGSLIKNMKA